MTLIPKYLIPELNATVYTLNKITSYEEMRDGIDRFYEGIFTKYMILDFTDLETHLSSEEVMKIGQQMSKLGKTRKNSFDLIVVPGLLQYGLGRMYAAYVEDISPEALQTKVFRSFEAAIKWINENEIIEKNKGQTK